MEEDNTGGLEVYDDEGYTASGEDENSLNAVNDEGYTEE